MINNLMATVYVCEMTKEVKPGYEFRASFLFKGKREDKFIHARSFFELKEKVKAFLRENNRIKVDSIKNGKRVKKGNENYKVLRNEGGPLKRDDIRELQQILKREVSLVPELSKA